MNLTQNEWIVVWVLCTVSLLIGWLSGQNEKRVDLEITEAESWTRHWASVRWVTRRTTPEPDDTVPS